MNCWTGVQDAIRTPGFAMSSSCLPGSDELGAADAAAGWLAGIELSFALLAAATAGFASGCDAGCCSCFGSDELDPILTGQLSREDRRGGQAVAGAEAPVEDRLPQLEVHLRGEVGAAREADVDVHGPSLDWTNQWARNRTCSPVHIRLRLGP